MSSKLDFTLPDGKILSFEGQVTGRIIAEKIGPGLAKAALGIKIDKEIYDLMTPLKNGGPIQILTDKNRESLDIIRHSCAHIMAAAVQRIFPKAQYTIGPVIEDGFFYDFDVEAPFTPEDLEKISREMAKLIAEKKPFVREEISRSAALKKMKEDNQPYKVEIINDLPDDSVISFYHNDYEGKGFIDLCRGPHIPDTGRIKAFALTSIAGAYWRGDSKNKMLQRIYGTAFFSKEELEEHLRLVEEAKKRDHRKVGKELGLFSFHQEAIGFPFYRPKGLKLLESLMGYMKARYEKEGYQYVKTPILMNVALWETSGHLANYAENMYFSIVDETKYAAKPMNCPAHCLMYAETKHSYRDLPLRMAEFGHLHRHELSGVVDGLKRTRFFTQDDAHLFCAPEQIEGEILKLLEMILETYRVFGFEEYEINLATKPEKAVGSDEIWEKATAALKNALDKSGVAYKIREGDGAFYGPKIDIDIRDALKRQYTLSTIQADFNLPERFDLKYTGPDGLEHRPVMIHRAICGSFDRTLAILIEHFGGVFPLWLAPEQFRIMPITDAQNDYSRQILEKFEAAGLRGTLDNRNDKIGYKIREATLQKVPYMVICGAKEAESGAISVRKRKGQDLGQLIPDKFIEDLLEEVRLKTIEKD